MTLEPVRQVGAAKSAFFLVVAAASYLGMLQHAPAAHLNFTSSWTSLSFRRFLDNVVLEYVRRDYEHCVGSLSLCRGRQSQVEAASHGGLHLELLCAGYWFPEGDT